MCLELPCCALFSDRTVAERTGVPLNQVQYILKLFSLPWDQVNREFRLPIAPVNQWDWPLIQAPDPNQFFLLSPCFSGYAFCQRLEALLIPQKPAVQKHLGDDVEGLVKQMLADVPHHHNGYYEMKEPGKKGKSPESSLTLSWRMTKTSFFWRSKNTRWVAAFNKPAILTFSLI